MRSFLFTGAVIALLGACQTTQTPQAVSAPAATAALPSDPEREAALRTRIATFNRAFKTHDYETVISVIPPRLAALLSDRAGMSQATFTQVLVKTTGEFMQDVKIHSTEMLFQEGSIKDAGLIRYALLPTRTDISLHGTRRVQETTTVALLDAGQWYLVRIEQPMQERTLKEAYPELKHVRLR